MPPPLFHSREGWLPAKLHGDLLDRGIVNWQESRAMTSTHDVVKRHCEDQLTAFAHVHHSLGIRRIDKHGSAIGEECEPRQRSFRDAKFLAEVTARGADSWKRYTVCPKPMRHCDRENLRYGEASELPATTRIEECVAGEVAHATNRDTKPLRYRIG